MKKYLIAVLGLILFIAGCAGGETTVSTAGKPFIGGTDAIEFNFLEGAPPPEVYDGDADGGTFPFEITLNVENKGERKVAAGDIKLSLLGFYPEDFGVAATDIVVNPISEDLDKAYIDSEGNTIPGGITYVTFGDADGFAYEPELKGNNEFPIRAELCYKYGTTAQADLCFLEDLTETSGTVCAVNENKVIESSSAPIQVENLQENVAGTDKITFSFEVVHRGTGAISMLTTGTSGLDCSDELGEKNKVKVLVTGLEELVDGTLDCGGIDANDYATLYGGKRIVRCTADLKARTNDFERKVFVDLEYNYKEHKDTSILVKHATG